MSALTKLHHDEVLKDQYRKIIDYILTSTKHGVNSPEMRNSVVNSIQRAISMSKTRGGKLEKPEDTEIYRIAELIKTATNWDEFKNLCSAVTRKKPVEVLKSFGLDWSPRFKLPEDVNTVILKREGKGKSVMSFVDTTPPKPQPTEDIAELHKKISNLEAEVKLLLVTLSNVISCHKHAPDGKIMLVTETEFNPKDILDKKFLLKYNNDRE